jgi:hypothetical protein
VNRPKPQWRRFLAEGLIIVLSILLAFGIDAWWDGLQESRRRDTLVSGLVSDFQATREQLASATVASEALVQRIGDFLSLRGSSAIPSLDSIQFLALGMGLPPPFAPGLPNYEAAVQSGEMGLLDNAGFYSALAGFEQAQEWTDRHWDLAFHYFFQGPIKNLRDRIGSIGPVMLPTGSACVGALFHPSHEAIYCPYPEDWALTAEEVVGLLNDRELYSGFEIAGNVQANYLIGLRDLDAAAERVLAALAALR